MWKERRGFIVCHLVLLSLSGGRVREGERRSIGKRHDGS